MDGVVRANFESESEPRIFEDGSRRWALAMSSIVIGRGVYLPGWRWSVHAGAQTGRPSAHHVGYVESGSLMVRGSNGEELLVSAGQAFEVGPDHDAWVVGDQPCVALDFANPHR